jgi:hypothetical protein
MEPLQFVNVTRCEAGRSKNTHALGVSEEDRRRIRIQVQRDFRRKEKQRRSNATSPPYDGSSVDPRSIKNTHDTPGGLLSIIGPPSQIPSTINSPELWLNSLAHSMIEDCYPRENGSMHVLENNVTYSYHMGCDAPMRAIREAASCLHVGSTLGHESILHEGIKRYVCAINSLREDAAQKKPRMTVSGLTMVGMGILLCQVRYLVTSLKLIFTSAIYVGVLHDPMNADFLCRSMRLYQTHRPRIHGKVTSPGYLLSWPRTSYTPQTRVTRLLGAFWFSR